MKRIFPLVLSLALFYSASSFASPESDTVSRAVEKTFQSKPESVKKMPMMNLWEVIVNKKIFYVDSSVRFVFAGHILDTKKNRDLTQERLAELSKVSWETLPLQDAVKVVYGKGERRLAVFTDTRCTYCRLLEQSIRQVGNVTVYNFLHPTPMSRALSRKIFCAENPAKAFQDYMLEGKEPTGEARKCDASALDRNLALGRRLGVAGTPVIIFSDGTTQAGSLAPGDLQARLTPKHGE
ncbi:MAG: DsbC family protein [Sutterella sp.]|nr:DsbC family protein [Sutterella sp.]MDD7427628.1 DsbC family protein [Sutterella sp.]MDY3272865.1 DsbC family protein [Duodenibacillus sp.]